MYPPSNGKHNCLVIVDSFSRFIQVYPVRSTEASDTIKAFEKFIMSFGIPQKLVYDKGSAFMNQDFTSWIHELGVTPAPRTAFSPWTNGKIEIQNKHLGAHFRMFLEQAGENGMNLPRNLLLLTTQYLTQVQEFHRMKLSLVKNLKFHSH